MQDSIVDMVNLFNENTKVLFGYVMLSMIINDSPYGHVSQYLQISPIPQKD